MSGEDRTGSNEHRAGTAQTHLVSLLIGLLGLTSCSPPPLQHTDDRVDQILSAFGCNDGRDGPALETCVRDAVAATELSPLAAELEDLSNRVDDLAVEAGDATDEIEDLDMRIASLELAQVPVGAVVDWYRPSLATPVPLGWVLLDGQSTCESGQFQDVLLPNTIGKFSRGVERQDEIGVVGGSDTHDHAVDISHDHSGSTSVDGVHDHLWASWDATTLQWIAGEGKEIYHYTDGMDSVGDGYYPLTEAAASATQDYNTNASGAHSHSVALEYEGDAVCEVATSVPQYVGFLRIMRCT